MVVHWYEKEEVVSVFVEESCIFVIEIARHFDITAIFNLHCTEMRCSEIPYAKKYDPKERQQILIEIHFTKFKALQHSITLGHWI